MAFSGKATYSAGSSLPEIHEDVSDIIGIVSPHETPLLDHLGDARAAAQSTIHEWLEDTLLPNTDTINDSTFTPDATTTGAFEVSNSGRFRAGDLIQAAGSKEVMLVTGSATPILSVTRGYGGTTAEALSDGQVLTIIGNAALEGAERPAVQFTNRARRKNFTQIFTAGVEVSGSMLASRMIGIEDELDYQTQERLRELLRSLENSVINGVASDGANPEGGLTARRSMDGILAMLETNRFEPGVGEIPEGTGAGSDGLTEEMLNRALREIWEQSSGRVGTILVNGSQKRRINEFVGDSRSFMPGDTRFSDLVSVYESDFGVARVVMSRWAPSDSVILLDSSRVSVLPLSGRSFHFKRLSSTGDSEVGQVIGEYTLELMNENAHGVLSGLAA